VIKPHIHVPYSRIAGQKDFIREKGFNLEIYFSGADLDTLAPDAVMDLRDMFAHQPALSFHAPFMDLSPGAVDSRVREATMARFMHIFEVAAVLRPRAIVFHSGYEKWRYGLNMEIWLEKSLLTWQPLISIAAETGTKIAIENIFEDDPSNLRRLMEALDSESVGICFDTGHFNIFSKTPLETWMQALNPYIVELHLHDNNKSFDEHLPIGEGNFDFGLFFHLLQNRSCLHTLEAHTQEHVLRSLKSLHRIKGIASGSA